MAKSFWLEGKMHKKKVRLSYDPKKEKKHEQSTGSDQ